MNYVLNISFSLILLLTNAAGIAQSDSLVSMPIHDDEIAEFPGGNQAMYRFIQENICYPDSAKKMGIEGKVYVSFIIDTTGKVIDPVIRKSMGKEFDTLVIQMMHAMPLWKPHRLNGRPIKSKYTLPVSFKLTSPEADKKKQTITATSCSEFIREKRKNKK